MIYTHAHDHATGSPVLVEAMSLRWSPTSDPLGCRGWEVTGWEVTFDSRRPLSKMVRWFQQKGVRAVDGRFVAGIAVAWVLTGVVLAVLMRRRGHHLPVWLALGSVLGPFAVPLALERLRDRPAPNVTTTAGCDLLVGVDGSADSVAALHDALALLGDRVTSVTVATVIAHDERGTTSGDEARHSARRVLDDMVSQVEGHEIHAEILYGRADEALIAYAEAAGAEVIAVGARGRGASRTLFGSTAERLAGRSPVPVLVGRKVN
jgi:nucleotide-binding universal stress UspA family protein